MTFAPSWRRFSSFSMTTLEDKSIWNDGDGQVSNGLGVK